MSKFFLKNEAETYLKGREGSKVDAWSSMAMKQATEGILLKVVFSPRSGVHELMGEAISMSCKLEALYTTLKNLSLDVSRYLPALFKQENRRFEFSFLNLEQNISLKIQ